MQLKDYEKVESTNIEFKEKVEYNKSKTLLHADAKKDQSK